MILEDALYIHLKANTTLKALVVERIYPLHLPQTPTYPAVVYEQISKPRYHTMGTLQALASPRVLFTCWGSTQPSAWSTAAAVIGALGNYSGTMGGDNGVTVQRVYVDDEYDGEADPVKKAYARICEFIIWHE